MALLAKEFEASPTTKWLIMVTVVLFLTLVFGALLVLRKNDLGHAEGWVYHTQEVILRVKDLDGHVHRMISAQRGYLLADDSSFVDSYESEKDSVQDGLLRLVSLVDDNPDQLQRIKDMNDAFVELTGLLEVHLNSRDSLLRDVAAFDQSAREEMNRQYTIITGLGQRVLNEEYARLSERLEEERSARRTYSIFLIISIILSMLLIVAMNTLILSSNTRRQAAEVNAQDIRDRLALAMQSTADGVFDWDLVSNSIYFSPRFKEMLGYRDNELENSIEIFNQLVHPDDRDDFWTYTNQYLRGQLSEYFSTFRMLHKHGGWIWINSRARCLYNQEGKPVRLIGANTDVTVLKETEEKLRREREMAFKFSQAKSDFLAHMSHEIRTPLNVVTGVANLLNGDKDLGQKERDELYQVLHDSSVSLLELINDILDLAKIESGEIVVERREFDLLQVLNQVGNIIAMRAREKGITFHTDYSELRTRKIEGDEARLRQVLLNLLGNAVKFTQEGSITLAARQDDRYIHIDIKDTGIGIRPEKLEEIFHRFVQADSAVSRQYGGSGLGLTIARDLAQLMGGDILVESEVDRGSTFTLRLPLSQRRRNAFSGGDNGTNLVADDNMRMVNTNLDRVLIAEDYAGNLVVLKYILESIPVQYDVAVDGAEAVEMYREYQYPLILMDIQMPKVDGFEATRRIRRFEEEEGLPPAAIVAMTAHAMAGDSERCIQAGMNDYMAKPLTESAIKSKLREYLMKKRASS